MKKHTRTKSKQLQPTNNNFSEKYYQYTKDKKFITPNKKSVNLKSEPKESSPTKEILNVLNRAVTPKAKPSTNKIKINMEIKNLNIFSSQSMGNLQTNKKKKLHKKTISCLQQPKQSKKKHIQPSENVKPTLKHKKTKSQENLKLSPNQWSELLTKYSKPKKTIEIQKENLISKFAYCNRTGFASQKKEKINQDTFIIVQNFMMNNRYMFGVCDGHGINGHYVSQFIREILPQNIEYFFIKNNLLHKQNKALTESSIKDAFLKTEIDLIREMRCSNIDIKFSGTTTVLTYIHENKIFCANLGDSRAVVFNRNANEKWYSKELSYDHKGENPVEAQRIIINGGRIAPYYDQDGEQMGPYRVWMKEQNIPGLAMTRSFGDIVASKVGVISEPEILQHQIQKENKFMVIASDGLWQFVQNEQVMNLVIPAFIRNDVNQAVEVLKNKAVQTWMREDENIDDITIIVIFFKYY